MEGGGDAAAHRIRGKELFAQAEVGEHHVAGGVEQHVLELQVAIDHTELHAHTNTLLHTYTKCINTLVVAVVQQKEMR